MNRNKRMARRHFLRRSAGAALGMAVPLLLWGAEAKAEKVPKSAMDYRNSPNGGQSCSGCIYFQPGASAAAPGTCSVVAGSISPRGYCIAFSPKV